MVLAIILVAGPIIYSTFYLDTTGINRDVMTALYNGQSGDISEHYKNRGELITRSAAWVSVLIILLALVKNKTKKK